MPKTRKNVDYVCEMFPDYATRYCIRNLTLENYFTLANYNFVCFYSGELYLKKHISRYSRNKLFLIKRRWAKPHWDKIDNLKRKLKKHPYMIKLYKGSIPADIQMTYVTDLFDADVTKNILTDRKAILKFKEISDIKDIII